MRLDVQHPLNVCRASAGTGKTYTLAAYYIGLLLSGEDYRSILAVTFTNKATAEMKERILTYLHSIANNDAEQAGFLATAREFMIPTAACAHPELLTDAQLRERAKRCFEDMLLDFDGVQVQTIDSFLQTLLSGMASMLSMAAGLQTELDVDRLIRQSVDQLLTTDATEESTRHLRAIVGARLENERSWDIREEVFRLARELYNEQVQMLDAEGKIVFDADTINAYTQKIKQDWEQNKERMQVAELLRPMRGVDYKAMMKKNGGDIVNFVANVAASLDDPSSLAKPDMVFRGLTLGQVGKLEDGKYDELGETATRIATIQSLLADLRSDYHTIQLTLKLTDEMQLMADLQHRINENLLEQNCALLARTANTLVQALRPGDADFVLEKAGIRFRHVLMDEFQDTSRLQWQVFEQLVRDVLAGEGHTLLIVGDIKQSIYRWRNGDWRIMADLGKDAQHFGLQFNKNFAPLSRNFRSRREVVQFNLNAMQRVVDRLCASVPMTEDDRMVVGSIYDEGFNGQNVEDYYNKQKTGGYVRLCSFNYVKPEAGESKQSVTEMVISDMFAKMEQLLSAGVRPDSMMVLVRRKYEALLLTQAFEQLDATIYPSLKQTRIVSADSFMLESSSSVLLLIHALRYRSAHDDVSGYYLRSQQVDEQLLAEIDKLSMQLPLYEMVSELIALLLCDLDALFCAQDQAYVHCFCDQVRAYVTSYGSSLEEFLQYWDDKMSKQAIPVPASDAISILTIHASKGLQAGTIFIPFCDWPLEPSKKSILWCEAEVQPEDKSSQMGYMPIQDGTAMGLSRYAQYHKLEQLHSYIDALNMLYVALTRAENNLFVYTHSDFSAKGELQKKMHIGSLLLESAPDAEQAAQVWEYGEPFTTPKVMSESASVFGFGMAAEKVSDIYCDSGQVRFCQSRDALMYLERGEAGAERIQSRIDMGNLCHDIFAHMRMATDAEGIIHDYYTRGLIESREQRDEVSRLIAGAWESEQMRHWFTDPWTLQLEQPIYVGDCELRPDRVMTNRETGRAIVLDYKFGGHDDVKYHAQVRQYMQAMQALGYEQVEGYLWYARERKLEEVKL